jgi:FAD synthetase
MNKKVLIAGTFDLIHPGHLFLINEAAKLGDVCVIISTDRNRELYSGEAPIIPQEQRLEVIKAIKNVKIARLGRSDNDTLKTVEEINPDIILLGPDQKYDIKTLKEGLRAHGLENVSIQRLNRYFDECELHSSRMIKQRIIERFQKKTSE